MKLSAKKEVFKNVLYCVCIGQQPYLNDKYCHYKKDRAVNIFGEQLWCKVCKFCLK